MNTFCFYGIKSPSERIAEAKRKRLEKEKTVQKILAKKKKN